MVASDSSATTFIAGIKTQNRGIARNVKKNNKKQHKLKTVITLVKISEAVERILLVAAISRNITLQNTNDTTKRKALMVNNNRKKIVEYASI